MCVCRPLAPPPGPSTVCRIGLRLARIVRRAEALDAAAETVSEEYGTRDGMSAADCAAWSDRQYAIACWEDRHGERWQGEW